MGEMPQPKRSRRARFLCAGANQKHLALGWAFRRHRNSRRDSHGRGCTGRRPRRDHVARGPACCAEPLISVERVCFPRTGISTSRENAFAYRHQSACKPGFVGHRLLAPTIRDGHSSGTTFTRCLEQPTRTASLTSLPRCYRLRKRTVPRCRPYSVLLPVWFAMPFPLPDPRCALTAPFHPYPPSRLAPPWRGMSLRACRAEVPGGAEAGGSFSVALSLGSPPPDVIRHRMSMEPGLSSPATFR
jgi:hypothetical protein